MKAAKVILLEEARVNREQATRWKRLSREVDDDGTNLRLNVLAAECEARAAELEATAAAIKETVKRSRELAEQFRQELSDTRALLAYLREKLRSKPGL